MLLQLSFFGGEDRNLLVQIIWWNLLFMGRQSTCRKNKENIMQRETLYLHRIQDCTLHPQLDSISSLKTNTQKCYHIWFNNSYHCKLTTSQMGWRFFVCFFLMYLWPSLIFCLHNSTETTDQLQMKLLKRMWWLILPHIHIF